MDFDYKKILDQVKKKNFIPRALVFILAVFILALNYNTFLIPNQIVTGGVSGLGIIFNALFGWEPATFIFILQAALIIVSFIFLGKDTTLKTLIGAILYPLFVSLSTPLAKIIIPYLIFENIFITVLLTAVVYGVSNGLIYKMGFTTGGSDIIMQIISKYFKIPTGKANMIASVLLLLFGGVMFGIDKLVYAVIVIYAASLIIDKIIIGISDSKMFFIYTTQIDKIKKFALEEMNTGVTFFNAEGGYSEEKTKILMCVVPTRSYYLFKESVLAIDPNAFFVINDCYEVKGGVKKEFLPFI